MQHPQQFSVLDKFWQDFRNSQILWKYDKSLSATPTTTTTTKSFLRTIPQYLLAFKKPKIFFEKIIVLPYHPFFHLQYVVHFSFIVFM